MGVDGLKGPFNISFKWPFKIVLCGVSGSGKTMFVFNLLQNIEQVADIIPGKILFVYREEQGIYDEFSSINSNIEFIKDIDDNFLPNVLSNSEKYKNLLIILDDQYFSKNLSDVAELYLISARHRKISIIFLTQSIFNNPSLKNISRNSTHIVLFKNIRLQEPYKLFEQFFPGKNRSLGLKNVYDVLMNEEYGYLLIDCSVNCQTFLRFRTDLFKTILRVFIIGSMGSFTTMFMINEKLKKELENIKPAESKNTLVDGSQEMMSDKTPSTEEDELPSGKIEKRKRDSYVKNSNPDEQYSLVKSDNLKNTPKKERPSKRHRSKHPQNYTNYSQHDPSLLNSIKPRSKFPTEYKPY